MLNACVSISENKWEKVCCCCWKWKADKNIYCWIQKLHVNWQCTCWIGLLSFIVGFKHWTGGKKGSQKVFTQFVGFKLWFLLGVPFFKSCRHVYVERPWIFKANFPFSSLNFYSQVQYYLPFKTWISTVYSCDALIEHV